MQNYLFLITKDKPRVPIKVLETIIVILVETGIVSLATILIPTVFDKGPQSLIVLGIIGTISSWSAAIVISWQIS